MAHPIALVTVLALVAGGSATAEDRGVGQRCVVHLTVHGGELDRQVTTLGQGDEWPREPPRTVQQVMWEGRGPRLPDVRDLRRPQR